MLQNAASRIFVLSGDELIVQAEHEDEQDDEGQTIGQVAAHPVMHLEPFAGVDFLLVVVPAPAVAGDAEQQVDEGAQRQEEVSETQKKLGDLLRFLQEAFGKGTELSMAVNDLTVAPVATAFLGQFLSTDYFAASRDLLLHRQSEQLLHQIDLTGLV